MYAAPSGKQGLSYLPYFSDGETYKQHFAMKQVYDCQPFHVIGAIPSMQMSNQGGKGEPTVKLVSPTEGAVERAEEEKKREDKEERKQKKLHSFIGSGARKTSQRKKKSTRVKRLGVKSGAKKKRVHISRRNSSKKNVKKSKPKKQKRSKSKTTLKRKK